MKILITGGTGVIGIALSSAFLNNDNNTVYVTSRKKRESQDSNLFYLCGDVHNKDFILQLDSDYDAIIDLMNYNTDELEDCINLLTQKTKKAPGRV